MDFRTSERGKLAPKTIHNVWKILKLILGKPTREWTIRLPGIPEKEQRYFTPEEAKKIIDAAEGQYKPLLLSSLRLECGSGK